MLPWNVYGIRYSGLNWLTHAVVASMIVWVSNNVIVVVAYENGIGKKGAYSKTKTYFFKNNVDGCCKIAHTPKESHDNNPIVNYTENSLLPCRSCGYSHFFNGFRYPFRCWRFNPLIMLLRAITMQLLIPSSIVPAETSGENEHGRMVVVVVVVVKTSIIERVRCTFSDGQPARVCRVK